MSHAQISLAMALLAIAGLNAMPAEAQPSRVFVAAQGSDANPCSFAQPCRTFQHAHDAVAAGGEIDVLDPAGYGTVIVTKSVSVQGHGFAGIAVTSNITAIKINASADDKINLRGLLLDGVGSGNLGILFNTGASLDVQDCLIRNFGGGGLFFEPHATSTLFVSNSQIAGNSSAGILVTGSGSASGVLDHVVVEGNSFGLQFSSAASFTVSNSVISNSVRGVLVNASGNSAAVVLQNVVISNNSGDGLSADGSTSVIRISKSTITGNGASFSTPNNGQIWSYGDNIIDGNTSNPLPSTTPLH